MDLFIIGNWLATNHIECRPEKPPEASYDKHTNILIYIYKNWYLFNKEIMAIVKLATVTGVSATADRTHIVQITADWFVFNIAQTILYTIFSFHLARHQNWQGCVLNY